MIWKLAHHHLNATPIPTQLRLRDDKITPEKFTWTLKPHNLKMYPPIPQTIHNKGIKWTGENEELDNNEMVLLKIFMRRS